MTDDIRKIIERRTDRRSFLRWSAFAAAAVIGSAALPRTLCDEEKKEKKDPADDKKDEKKDQGQEKDPYKETKIDQNGREYRICPVCGFNMYRQDRTWTCENCGYSYT